MLSCWYTFEISNDVFISEAIVKKQNIPIIALRICEMMMALSVILRQHSRYSYAVQLRIAYPKDLLMLKKELRLRSRMTVYRFNNLVILHIGSDIIIKMQWNDEIIQDFSLE